MTNVVRLSHFRQAASGSNADAKLVARDSACQAIQMIENILDTDRDAIEYVSAGVYNTEVYVVLDGSFGRRAFKAEFLPSVRQAFQKDAVVTALLCDALPRVAWRTQKLYRDMD